jgi:hypothetical protein
MNNQDIDQVQRQHDEVNEEMPLLHPPTIEPYSVFTSTQKRLIILTAALASSFSPLSANIYYPALNSIAKDLRVSPSKINLTITTYMVYHKSTFTIPFECTDIPGFEDMPGPRSHVNRVIGRPSRSSTLVHPLLRDIYSWEHCFGSTTQFS